MFLPAATTGFAEDPELLAGAWEGCGACGALPVPAKGCKHPQQPLVVHSLTLMDVQVPLDQAGIFTVPRGLGAGRTELQRWVAPRVLVAP